MLNTANPAVKSIGEERVRVDFNPSASDAVSQIKQKAAELINLVFQCGNDGRLTSLAATAFEEGAMWAVKSATAPVPMPNGMVGAGMKGPDTSAPTPGK